MKEIYEAVSALLEAIKKDNGVLSISSQYDITNDAPLRILYSSNKHPALNYERMPHSENCDQMVAHIGEVEIAYLVDKDEE